MTSHARTAAVASLVIATFFVAGCGESNGDDTGTGGTSTSGGTGGSGGTEQPASGGSAGGAARGGSGATAGLSSGGSAGKAGGGGMSSGGASGAAGAGAGGDGGSAGLPSDCLPPCLAELFDGCTAQTSCIEDAPEDSLSSVLCEPATGWRVESTFDVSGNHADPDLVASVNGRTCYTASYVMPNWTYKDPSGTVVAIVTLDADGNTGRCPALETPGEEPTVYPIKKDDPRCAGVECTPGKCP